MKTPILFVFVLFAPLLACNSATSNSEKTALTAQPDTNLTAQNQYVAKQVGQIACPEGFQRTKQKDGSFGSWLRKVKINPNDTVYLHTGEVKYDQSSHLAVLDFDIGKRDLQQCADAVIRLRAEYLWAMDRKDEIAFNFTSGHRCSWKAYSEGYRPKIMGNRVSFAKVAGVDKSYKNFRRYLNLIFTYCGTYSLHKELAPVKDPSLLQIGDVYIQTGNPYGHAVIVMDCATNDKGEKVYLLAQSYMPAQSIHILLDPAQNKKSAWYKVDSKDQLPTPHWDFYKHDLKRFAGE